MIMVYGTMRKFYKCLELLSEMKINNSNNNYNDIKPSLNTFINLVNVCARCKNYAKMLDFYSEVKHSELFIT